MIEIDRLKALLIVTYRPEFAPPWIGGPYVSALTLNRLPRREIGEMVARIVGDKRCLEEVCRDIIERADGVPLFAEEIAKAAVEATGEGGAERVLAGVPSPVDAVPASLHASLMSRLDQLGAAIQDRPGTAKVRPKQTYTNRLGDPACQVTALGRPL